MFIFRFSLTAEGTLIWLCDFTVKLQASQSQHPSWYNDWSVDFSFGQYTVGASRLVKQYLKGGARIRERAKDRIDSGALSEYCSAPNLFPIALYAQSKRGRAEDFCTMVQRTNKCNHLLNSQKSSNHAFGQMSCHSALRSKNKLELFDLKSRWNGVPVISHSCD